MIINLSPNLEPMNLTFATEDRLLNGIRRKTKMKMQGKELIQLEGPVPDQFEFYQLDFFTMLANAYSQHYGIVVAPHDIWMVTLSVVSSIIKESPDQYRSLFTKNSSGKETLLVMQDHPYRINTGQLFNMIEKQSSLSREVLLPSFSTATDAYNESAMTAVLDAASQYYDYGMFCCGLRFVDLRGTVDDWNTIYNSCRTIINTAVEQGMEATDLVAYLIRLCDFIAAIMQSFSNDNQNADFWMSLFTKKNVGSGGQLSISGHICTLYNRRNGSMADSFPSSMGSFEYKNMSTQQNYMMASGCFGSNLTPEGALEGQYATYIFEKR